MIKIIIPIHSSAMQPDRPIKPAVKKLLAQMVDKEDATILFAIEGSASTAPLSDLTKQGVVPRIISCLAPQPPNDNLPSPRGGIEAIQAMLKIGVLEKDDLCIVLNPETDFREDAIDNALKMFQKYGDYPVVSASEERDHVAQLEACYRLVTADVVSAIEQAPFKETGLRATLPGPFLWSGFCVLWPEHSGVFIEPDQNGPFHLSEIQTDEATMSASNRRVWNWAGNDLAQRLMAPEDLKVGDTSLSFSSLYKRNGDNDALLLEGFPENRELFLSCDCGDKELLFLAWPLDEKGMPETSTIVIPISPDALQTERDGRKFRKYQGDFDQLSGVERFAYMVVHSVNNGGHGEFTFRVPLFFQTPLVSFDPIMQNRRNEASGEEICGRQQLPTVYTADKGLAVLYARQACIDGMKDVRVINSGNEASPYFPAPEEENKDAASSSREQSNHGIQMLRDAIVKWPQTDQMPQIRRRYERKRYDTLLEINVWKALTLKRPGNQRAFHHFSYDIFVGTFWQHLERTRVTLVNLKKDLLDMELRHSITKGDQAFAESNFEKALHLWEQPLKQNPLAPELYPRIRDLSEKSGTHMPAADEATRFYKLIKRPDIKHDILADALVADMALNAMQGRLFLAGFKQDAVYTFDLEGNFLGRHPGDYATPISVSVGSKGELWVCDFSNSRLVALNNQGAPLFDINLKKLLPATRKTTRPLNVWAGNDRVVAIVGNEAMPERIGILFRPEAPKESLRILDDKQWEGSSSLFEMNGVFHMLNGYPGNIFAINENGALQSVQTGQKLPLFPRKALSVGKDLFICGQKELLKIGHQGHSYKVTFETLTGSTSFLPVGQCIDDNNRLYLTGKRAGSIYVFDV